MGNIRYKGGNYTKDTRSSYIQVEPLSIRHRHFEKRPVELKNEVIRILNEDAGM